MSLFRKLKRSSRHPGEAAKLFILAGLGTLILLAGGWLLNFVAGVDITYRLAVGSSAEIVKSTGAGNGEDGLAIVLQRRIDDYGPADIRVALRERRSGKGLGVLDLHERGGAVTLAGTDLQVSCERFDDVNREFFLQLQSSEESEEQAITIGSQPWREVVFGDYVLTLLEYRLPPEDLQVRVKLGVLDAGNMAQEFWLVKGREVHWQGYGFRMLGWESAADGLPLVLIQVRKTPGHFLYFLALLPLLVAVVVVLWRRRRGPSSARGEGGNDNDPAGEHRRLFFFMALVCALFLLEAGALVTEWTRDYLIHGSSLYFDIKNPVPAFEPAVEKRVKVYRRTTYHRLLPGRQSFLREKPANGYRVFVLGGSAASGWPYEVGEFNLSRLLEKKLKTAFPERRIEVINAAGGTFGSHRVRLLFDELIDYQPDLIVLYSGNNEFLENFVFRRSLPPSPWKYLALGRLSYDLYSQFDNFRPEYDIESYTIADQTSNRIAYAFGKASTYRSDPEQFEEIKRHYRENISHIVSTSRKRGVQSVILNVPVNLKDWSPNASRHSSALTPANRKLWQENFRHGYRRLEKRDYAGAVKLLNAATSIDGEYAETYYYLGLALQRLGDFPAAKAAFVKALERDAYPFRALPEFQEILQEISKEEQVPLVDIVGALEARSEDGMIGLDLLLDYVHPKESSQEIIAQQIIQTLYDKGLLPQPIAVPLEALRIAIPPDFRPWVEAQAIESIYGQNLIMRQYDKLDQIYQTYLATVNRAIAANPALRGEFERHLEIIKTIHPIVMAYREVLLAEKMGVLQQEFSTEEAETIYRRYVELIQAMEAPEMSREAFILQVPKLDFGSEGK